MNQAESGSRAGLEIEVLEDSAALAHEAARRFIQLAQPSIDQRGRFAVALAGGSTPAALYRLLAQEAYRGQVNWARTWIFFSDERCVSPDSRDSNYQMARETLLDHVLLPEANIFRIHGEWPPQRAADAYALQLRAKLKEEDRSWPQLDLALLGMGDDGHTASLFPGMPALAVMDQLVVATGVPDYVQPNVARVTLTLPVLNAAAQVLFLVAGEQKAGAVARVLGRSQPAGPLPAGRVRPTGGALTWLLDRAAAQGLGRPAE
jgi:6-phosphogluconolactonase